MNPIKLLVRVLVFVVGLLALIIAAIAGLPWLPVLGEQFGAGPYRDHLAKNETVLALEAPDAGFQLTPDDLDARYIILGEMHGFAIPQRLDAGLIIFLQGASLQGGGAPRWYLAEMTPREAIAVNEFLSGGSDRYARAVFDRFAKLDLQWANKEFFEKLATIRAFNQSVPAERHVLFLGIDRDRSGDPLELPEIDALRQPDLGDRSTARAINDALLAVQAEGTSRYAAMKARLTALAAMPGFDQARFYGLWGIFHASEAPINGSEPFARWLQDAAAPYAGEVLTINTLCVGDCFNMMPAAALPPPMVGPAGERYTWVPMGIESPYFQRPDGVSDLTRALGTDRAALYRLAGENSPYNKGRRLAASSGYLVMMKPWNVEGATTDMTDYILVYRDSAPLNPWSGKAFDVTGQAAAAK